MGEISATVVPNAALLAEVTQFIYREARLQDEHQYDAWEALWTDDGIYWVPASGTTGGDPDTCMSIIYDNRSRIALRIRQFHTGRRYSQIPVSRLSRVVSNIEIIEQVVDNAGDTIRVGTAALVFESARRGEVLWPSRNEYVLCRINGELRMAMKKVVLTNSDKDLLTMAFLI